LSSPSKHVKIAKQKWVWKKRGKSGIQSQNSHCRSLKLSEKKHERDTRKLSAKKRGTGGGQRRCSKGGLKGAAAGGEKKAGFHLTRGTSPGQKKIGFLRADGKKGENDHKARN